MEKRRMYYFDGKNIINNEDASTQKVFDQNFDELHAGEVFRSSNEIQNNKSNMNYNSNLSGSNNSFTNINNFMMSGEYQDQFKVEENTKSQFNLNNNHPQENQMLSDDFSSHYNQQTLLSEALVTSLKDQYYKTKGYIENKPDILLDFIIEYKNFHKRGMRVPVRIQPFLSFSNEDIYYSLTYYHSQLIMSQSKIKTGTSTGVYNKFKTKFTTETLKRLYPKLKTDEEMQKIKSMENKPHLIEKFINRLIIQYYQFFKEYTNDANKLFDFWLRISHEDKEKFSLQWDLGERNLEININKFFDDEILIERLLKIFQNVCGYECYHPRPLHDYWVKQISYEDKFIRGLFKYDTENLYKILEEYYDTRTINEKQISDEKLKKSLVEEKIKKNKNKVSKEQLEKLKKKFEILAKPQDKWRTGRAMLNIRKQFQYDNIIQKMIKIEFEANRVFKFPEEYALYDKENSRKILFKNSLEKNIKKENEDGVKELITQAKLNDESKKIGEERQMAQIFKEDMFLEKYLKKMGIKYYKISESRHHSGTNVSINHFLTDMYLNMMKIHTKATRRRFPKMKEYGKTKKSRFSNFPKGLKIYFFNLFRRIGQNSERKYIFANNDNMSFWGPSMSNKCKVHSNNCPLYCKNNTHNEVISMQRSKNFNILYNLDNMKLEEDERLHLWKRKDENLIDLKSKIFLCLNEAEHCTFEPKINKKDDDIKLLSNEDVINKRISNKVWVTKMGENFSDRFPLVYKEGILKKVSIPFSEGKFTEVLKVLEDAFDLDLIKAHFDKKFEIIYKKKKDEENKLKIKNEQEGVKKNDVQSLLAHQMHGGEKKKIPEKDDFNNSKNLQICQEVFKMIKSIEDYKKNKIRTANKIKEELKIIESAKNEGKDLKKDINSKKEIISPDTLHKTNYIKDRYFKFFKTLMCPLKNECPYDIRPRWPHSDLKANVPFGQGCPYAHHISELKFEQEVREKLKLKKNFLKELEKDEDPAIYNEWVPTGPIIPCNGCGKTFSDKSKNKGGSERVGAAGGPKGLCGYCRYNQKNDLDLKSDKIQADKTNKQILKKINYGANKAEEWDQEYVAKFGKLKKASVLYSFKRYTDALVIMEKLKEMVNAEEKTNNERFITLDKKWRTKLLILDQEIPKEILDYDIVQEIMDYYKIKIPLSTLLVYTEKMRKGNCFSIYNRHTFLNNQILQFYKNVKKTLDHYKVDIKMLKEQLEELNTWNERKDKLKNENPNLYQKFYKKFRAEMCPNIVNGKKCPESYRDCKFAHSSNQLNLTQVHTSKKLLNNTLNETQNKMKKSNTLVPWKYPRQKVYEQGLKFDKTLISRNSGNNIRSKSEKRSKSIDLKKLKMTFHEI